MLERERWFDDNRANWDDRAALHEAAGYGIEALIADPAALPETVVDDIGRLGDLAGRDIIHLQCHLGTDTVGLKRLGATRVVGVDLSPESLRRARRIAQQCATEIEYVESNVYDARTTVEGDFDVVYTSVGVLCWLPDVEEWARVIASLLRPGGRFVIRDDHPMFMSIGEDVMDGLTIRQPYFQREQPLTWDEDFSYIPAPESADPIQHTVNHQWNHSLGQIVTALINAGLVIDSLEELQYSAWCPWPELMEKSEHGWRLRENPERLPLQFAITARVPGA